MLRNCPAAIIDILLGTFKFVTQQHLTYLAILRIEHLIDMKSGVLVPPPSAVFANLSAFATETSSCLTRTFER